MNWKGRKMFSSAVDMQSGGSVPYPSYESGGVVGAVGATPTERKRMFSIWDKMTQDQKEKAMDGNRYQIGGPVVPTPLFEEGDQDINMALNTMASTTSPSVSDVKESVSMGPSMEDSMTMDQGPMNFEQDLMDLKQDYKNEIFSFIEKPGAVEKLQPFLKTMQLSYQNDLTDMMKRHGVKEYSPEQELFTPEFMEEVKMAFVVPEMQEMQDGGVAMPTTQEQLDSIFSAFPGTYTLEDFGMLPKQTQQMLITRALIEKGTKANTPSVTTEPFYSPQEVKTRLNEIINSRIELAKQSGVMPQTKQGGILGFASQVNALRSDQADKISSAMQDEANLLKALATGSKANLDKNTAMPMDLITKMVEGDDPSKNDEAVLKLAQNQAKQVEEEVPLLGHVYFRQMSPQGFFRMFPHYSGTKEINGVTYTIDEWIEKALKDSNVDLTDSAMKDLAVAGALGSWVSSKETFAPTIEGGDPAGIR